MENSEDIIYRSYRQGGTRYNNAISDNGTPFSWEFEENLYMKALPIWDQLSPDKTFKPVTSEDIFGNNNPLYVEIGIGNGEFIAHHAKINPDQNWIGFEVYHKIFEKAVSKSKKTLAETDAQNIRLLQFDAELFVRMLADSSVHGFFVNFPDPWPKAKHTKRRILKTWFMNLMREKLVPGGIITVATDHDDYAEEITQNFSEAEGLESVLGAPFLNDIGDYYKTKYYRKFAEKGTVYFYKMKRIER